MEVTQERVKELLHYDETTGLLINKARRRGIIIGTAAGTTKTSDGYRHIAIDYVIYPAHRLVWLYVYGTVPDILDHVNGDRLDNRLDNLREANKALNGCNKEATENLTTGVKGLVWYSDSNKQYYYARVTYRGKTTSKCFNTDLHTKQQALILATAWVRAKRIELHGEFANHG